MLDWSFVTLLSSALLFFLFALFSVALSIMTRRKLRPLKKRPPKNKRKRKQFILKRRKFEKQVKRQRNSGIILFVLMLMTTGGAFYTRHYQMNNLNANDSESIVQSYYLLDEVELQLSNIKNNENPQKSIKNLRELSLSLSSYGARRAYQGLTEEGQILLNRHFILLKELGTNLSSQTVDSLGNTDTMEGYQKDVKKVKDSQKKVFKRFKVNEAALKSKK
ncbi:hypothetical protein RV15_GL003545 [Enterococcus silesiacus]|nr:hypothetical protein RV15_GL003545 [Enterococcus silesiacus]